MGGQRAPAVRSCNHPKNRFAPLSTRAQGLFQEIFMHLLNRFREAIIEYKNVVQIDPKDAKVHNKLGLSHLKVGQLREAFFEFTKSVEFNPDLLDARIQLGNLYLLSKDPKKAREQADYVFKREPNNPSGRLLMSSVYWKKRI